MSSPSSLKSALPTPRAEVLVGNEGAQTEAENQPRTPGSPPGPGGRSGAERGGRSSTRPRAARASSGRRGGAEPAARGAAVSTGSGVREAGPGRGWRRRPARSATPVLLREDPRPEFAPCFLNEDPLLPRLLSTLQAARRAGCCVAGLGAGGSQ